MRVSFTITASPAPTSAISVKVGVSESSSFGATGAATVIVADNDEAAPKAEITITVEEASASEGDELEFTVRLSQASTEEITVTWNTATAWDVTDNRAHGGEDYEEVFSGKLVFAAGGTEMTGRVRLVQDGEAEGDEYFAVELFLPDSSWPPDATVIMTIVDDD